MAFTFRTSVAGAVMIPASLVQQVDTSQSAFIKCFLALPQQKYKLVRTIATHTVPILGEWITLNNESSDDSLSSKIFLKIKLFAANQDQSYTEFVFAGCLDITQVLETLSRSRSLRKLLVTA